MATPAFLCAADMVDQFGGLKGIRGDYEIYQHNSQVYLERYLGSGGEVLIPGYLNGNPVVYIADAFSNRTDVTSVTFPGTVTEIGPHAFDDCTNLTRVTIPDSVTAIRESAFCNCSRLTRIAIPESVKKIELLAFGYCKQLSRVTLNEGLVEIGDAAFTHCENLAAISFPSTVRRIERAFEGCGQLEQLNIPARVTKLAGNLGADNVTAIHVDERNPVYSSLGGVVFNKDQSVLVAFPCGRSGEYRVPDLVRTIADGAFAGARRLTNVLLPDSLEDIGEYAFKDCAALASIAIPPKVDRLKSLAFYSCSKLGSVTIANGRAEIDKSAFDGAGALTNVSFTGNPGRRWPEVVTVPPGWAPLKITRPLPSYSANDPGETTAKAEPRESGQAPPVLQVPPGLRNLARDAALSCSDSAVRASELGKLTDGNKDIDAENHVYLRKGPQYVQLDLKVERELFAIVLWHAVDWPQYVHGVTVLAAADAEFTENRRVLFNNDQQGDNGFGQGADLEYVDDYRGKLIDAKGVKARYLRFYSNGTSVFKRNPYFEIEVYGR